MGVQIEQLQSIPYFSGLSSDELGLVKKLVVEKQASRGELLVLEDDLPEMLYYVVSGAVKVFKTSTEGKEQIIGIARPGLTFNDVSVFDGGSNPASAAAMGPVVLYAISRDNMHFIVRDYPKVALNVATVLAGRVRHLLSLVEDLSFRHVIGRVAKILLEYAGDRQGPKSRLTQQDMAAMAGTAREVIGRSLKALEEEGTIRMDRHQIVIADKEALAHLVESAA